MTINYLRGICVASIALLTMTCSAQTNAIEPRSVPDAKSESTSDAENQATAEKVAPPKSTLSKSDREKIQRVITLQLRAFERNDEAIAFSYATADTRKYFGTPRQFMDMVRLGYAPLLKHSSREFLEAANVNGLTIQPVKFLTTDGDIVVALYTMERQVDSEWRIGGCELAPKSLQAT
jgi:Domain of unknown function (DUF4864)